MRKVLVVLIALVLTGCGTANRSVRPVDSRMPEGALNSEERFLLNQWFHAAETAEQVEDLGLAVDFYGRVAKYFPDTGKGEAALQRLQKLRKSFQINAD